MSTLVVYGDAADGFIWSDDLYYSSARSGASEFVFAQPAALQGTIGQIYDGDSGYYGVRESFLSFDTSAIGTDTVSAAVLRVTSNADASDTDFDIQARLRDWGATLTTADWVAGSSLSGLTSLATKTTASGFTAGTAYDFTDVAMPANVNKTGTTRMLLCSSRTTGNNEPTGAESVGIYSADESGTTRDPKLTVTYAAGGSTLFLMLEDDSGAYELEDDSGGILLEPGA